MKLFKTASLLFLSIFTLSGCLVISPYNNQVLTSRSQTIPFQAWAQKNTHPLRVECMPTNRYGPEISSHGDWTQIGTIPVSQSASLDLNGSAMYSAAKKMSLPESCWHQNGSNHWYYSSIRILQEVDGSSADTHFHTVDREGVRCVGESVADNGGWAAWLTNKCYLKYSTGNAIKWMVIRTDT